jgi:hypothetical protein
MEQKKEDGGQRTAGAVELKPCPFCGGHASVCHDEWIACDACGAMTGSKDETGEKVAAWNRRVPSERDEFAEIILRLKQRGLIPETFDAATLEVAHA